MTSGNTGKDGTIQPFTGSDPTNKILIVRIPDESLTPGKPKYQLACNPLVNERVTTEFPATKFLRSILIGDDRDSTNDLQSLSGNESSDLNVSNEDTSVNADLHVQKDVTLNDSSPEKLPAARVTYPQGIAERGGPRRSYSASANTTFMGNCEPLPWVEDAAFRVQPQQQQYMPPRQQYMPPQQQYMPPQQQYTPPQQQYTPPQQQYTPPQGPQSLNNQRFHAYNHKQPLFHVNDSNYGPRYEPPQRRNFRPNHNQRMQRSFEGEHSNYNQDYDNFPQFPNRRPRGRFGRGSNRQFNKRSSWGYHKNR